MRSSFRDGDKIKHTNHGRITGLGLDQLKLIQAAFRGDVIPKDSPQAFQTINSRESAASCALLQLAKELGLDKALYSRNKPWVQDCLAMIAGRILYAGSKLALSNEWRNTALWELCGGQGPVDVEEHCYEPMDRLLERQKAIQCALAAKHLQNAHLVLYDITSTYFEGAYAQSQIVLFGYNRDGGRATNKWSLVCCATRRDIRSGSKCLPATPKMRARCWRRCRSLNVLWLEGGHLRRRSRNNHPDQRGEA